MAGIVKGHNGGFNPNRDANGRWTGGGSGAGGRQINAAIRRAAGKPAPVGSREWMKGMIREAPGRGPDGTMEDGAVRHWYNAQVEQIGALNDQWAAAGVPAHERAAMTHAIRHDARVAARAAMKNRAGVEQLRQRDIEKYGNPDGPTFAYLVADWRRRGVQSDDEIYAQVIGGSARTNAEVNARFGRQEASP